MALPLNPQTSRSLMRMSIVFRVGLVAWLIAAMLSNAIHATEPVVDFNVHLDVALRRIGNWCSWQ